MKYVKFGEILRGLLEERYISQKQLASELNLLAPTLGRYIRGEREPDMETIKMIAAYFSVSTDYLLDYRSGKVETRDEDELLRIFRSMTDEQREIYIAQGRAVVQLNKNNGDI